MKQKGKRGSDVYVYLESIGLLQKGSVVEIKEAKKKYWAIKRNEWKKNKRKASKSYTVYFDVHEQRIVAESANQNDCSITNYIKQVSLCGSQKIISKKTIGEIHEAIVVHYSSIQTNEEAKLITSTIASTFLRQLEIIENKIMHALNQQV